MRFLIKFLVTIVMMKCLSIHVFEFVFSLFGFGDGSGRTPQQIWLHDLTIYELRTIKDNK